MTQPSFKRSLSEASSFNWNDHKELRSAPMPDQIRTNYERKPVEDYRLGEPYQYQKHEALPCIPFLHSNVGVIVDLIEEMVNIVSEPLDACEDLDGELRKLRGVLADKQTVTYGDKLKIALVGDAGAGKSSFINAFLEHDGLALANSGGVSCTQVVTEYVDDATAECCNAIYFARVRLKSKDSIDEEIRYYFLQCAKFATQDDAGSSDSEDEMDSVNDDEAEAGLKFLCQLFRSEPKYSDEDALLTAMRHMTSQAHEVEICRLQACCENMLQYLFTTPDSREVHIKCVELDQLTMALQPYTEMQTDMTNGFWPVVETVQQGLDSRLLRQGFQIADVPGLNDKDLLKKKITERYLRSCNMVIVVGRCERIASDANVMHHLRKHLPGRNANSVLLLATRTDQAEETPKEGILQSEREHIRRFENAVKSAEAGKKKLKSGSDDYKAALENVKAAKARLQGQRALIRNNIIARKFQTACKRIKGSLGNALAQIKIIPISAKVQLQYMRGEGFDEVLCYTPAEAGLLSTRAYICGRALNGRFEAIEWHVKDGLQETVSKVNIVLGKTLVERINNLRQFVEESRVNSIRDLGTYQSSLQESFDACLSDEIHPNYATKDGPWVQWALTCVVSWKSRFKTVQTIKAFCRKGGVHKPSGDADLTDLNEELFRQPQEDVYNFVDVYRKSMKDVEQNIIQSNTYWLNHLELLLRENIDIGGNDSEDFWSNFQLYRARVEGAVTRLFDQICDKMRGEFNYLACSSEGTGVMAVMHRIYSTTLQFTAQRKAKTKGAKHVSATNQWLDHMYLNMHTRMPNSSLNPFNAFESSLAATFEKLLTQEMKKLTNILVKPFEEIREDLELAFGGGDGDDETRIMSPESRKELKSEFLAVLPAYEQKRAEALGLINEVKVWYAERLQREKQAIAKQEAATFGLAPGFL